MFESAAEFARECGVDRTTVVNWIRIGKLKARRFKNKKYYKIPEKEKEKIKIFQKPYPKWQKPWTKAEENLIIYSSHLKDKELAKILGRSEGSLRVHKTIMRKKGLL